MENKHDFENVRRWSDLSWDEKKDYTMTVNCLKEYLNMCDETNLHWKSIDDALHLSHLYRFTFDDLCKEQKAKGKTLYFDEEGLHLINGRRIING